jgi:hypothetical protein
MQKKAAAKKYGPLLTGDNGEQAVKEAMTADLFEEEDIAEVIFEIKSQPNDGADQAGAAGPIAPVVTIQPEDGIAPAPAVNQALVADTKPKTLNKVYEEFRVAPEHEEVKDQMGKVLGNKLTGFRKLDIKPLKTTSIHPDKAEELNSQSINTGLRLYEKK